MSYPPLQLDMKKEPRDAMSDWGIDDDTICARMHRATPDEITAIINDTRDAPQPSRLRLAMRGCLGLAAVLCATVQFTACGGASGTGVGCMADSECGGPTPRCDKNTGACVPCLPANDNCPMGKRCVVTNDSFACSGACMSAADCPKTDSGGAAACCGGACLDSSTDTQNCGGCGRPCAAPPNGTAACIGGVCGLGECGKGFADCDKMLANGCEVTLASDIRSCGACGKVCPAGANQTATCTDGACGATCAKGFAHCSINPADGCEVNTATDLKNCGACNTACGNPANGVPGCAAGACVVASCNPGFGDCNMKFVDGCEAALGSDVANCGACGTACPVPANAQPTCKAGSCGVGACAMGFSNCDGLAGNGCEVNTGSDARNCGACSAVCGGPNSAQSCMNGMCTITACSPGFADCDGMPANGCEASTGTDPANCGGCAKACPVPANAIASCANAQCGIGGCKPGFADCNKLPGDGCEADLAAPVTCGACNNSCPAPANAAAGCKVGVCGLGACNMGFSDCDGNPANGCEKNTNNDVNNCGKCAAVCSFANATPGCLGGVCGIVACTAGFFDCDKAQNNGCEVNTNTDARNCGACANVCPMNSPICMAGKCVGLYAPVGPQTNVPIANLTGWTQCFIDTYEDLLNPSLAQLQATCSKAKLMLACRPTGSQTLQLLAWAPRADVLFDIGDFSNTPHNANGTGWYYSTDASWGFALQGDVINRSACDIKASSFDATGGHGNLRLCFHTAGGTALHPGWRCGTNDNLGFSNAFERVIYHAD